jgi:hypothetical protein
MPPRLDLFRTAGRGGAHRLRRACHLPSVPPGLARRGSIAALLVLGTAATASGAAGAGGAGAPPEPAVTGLALADRDEAVSRSHPRTGPAPEAVAADPDPSPEPAKPSAEAAPAVSAEPEPPAVPAPIGGLNERQMAHAAAIVRAGQQTGMPKQAFVVALATAMQESTLRVLASQRIPESYQYAHDGDGYDHDSVGLFQQRPSMGWGTVQECMDPETSARTFYRALARVPGWRDLPITLAAQAVQRSAYPYHYAKHEGLARRLVAALT